jgi:hypothetical protein
MSFPKRAMPIQFAWEEAAGRGVEFIEPINSRNAVTYWPRIFRTLKEGSGVLIVRSYEQPTGIISSVAVLSDILLGWRKAPTTPHTYIENGLLRIAQVQIKNQFLPFRGVDLSVVNRPRSVSELLRQLDREGKVTIVRRWKNPAAFLVGIEILLRLRNARHKPSSWADEVASWVLTCKSELL